MSSVVKTFLVPGSISFLVAALIIGVALLYGTERMRRWGRRWLTVLLVVYGFLATPLGADWVAAPLARSFTPIASKEQARGIDTIVVLSNGGEVYRAYGGEIGEMGKNTSFNALETARLHRLIGPRVIVASGGVVDPKTRTQPEAEVLAAGLMRLGVPRDRIVVEAGSRTTREQAMNVAAILARRGVKRFLIVTTTDHMSRAVATFRDLSLDPVPSVPRVAMSSPPGVWYRLRPSVDALRQSDWACYEYLARVYYWARGWL